MMKKGKMEVPDLKIAKNVTLIKVRTYFRNVPCRVLSGLQPPQLNIRILAAQPPRKSPRT